MSKLILKNVRLSFADLFTPVSKFDGPEKFSACFIIDPKSDDGKANLAGFKKIVRALEAEKFGGDELPTDKLPSKMAAPRTTPDGLATSSSAPPTKSALSSLAASASQLPRVTSIRHTLAATSTPSWTCGLSMLAE